MQINDNNIQKIFNAMESHISDENQFIDNLNRNLDFVQVAKERNDRMVKAERKRLLNIVGCGLLIATIIVLAFVFGLSSGGSIYTMLYVICASFLSSVAIIVYGLVSER